MSHGWRDRISLSCRCCCAGATREATHGSGRISAQVLRGGPRQVDSVRSVSCLPVCAVVRTASVCCRCRRLVDSVGVLEDEVRGMKHTIVRVLRLSDGEASPSPPRHRRVTRHTMSTRVDDSLRDGDDHRTVSPVESPVTTRSKYTVVSRSSAGTGRTSHRRVSRGLPPGFTPEDMDVLSRIG